MTQDISVLKDKYKNKTVYIIGKGPSLKFLKKQDIEDGVVITINDAIAKIEELNIDNDVYAMEKDGWYIEWTNHQEEHDCSIHSIMPTRYPVLLHKHESPNCIPDYFNRIIFNNLELGLEITRPSAISAIKIGELMGCDKFVLISFDACTIEDYSTYIPGTEEMENNPSYKNICVLMNQFLDKLNYKWITPQQ